MSRPLPPDRVRYVLHTPSLRSAHLERMVPLEGDEVALTLLATGRHPDCDDALLAATDLDVVVTDDDGAEQHLRAAPPDVLEVTEPTWTAQWPLARRLVRAAREASGGATRAVTYAIDNRPPDEVVPDADLLAAVVFGTADAAATYARVWPGASWAVDVVEERRPRCPCLAAHGVPPAAPDRPAGREVVLVAELSERKGVDVLQDAWPVVAADPGVPAGWRLRVLGYGPRLTAVQAWAGARDDVEVVASADREQVHAALRRAAVLVLPSRRTSQWREQVGLSLVEGLAHGCAVVTTTETGLAAGLAAAGHEVVAPDDAGALAAGLVRALAGAGDRVALPAAGGRADSRVRATLRLATLARGPGPG